MRIGRLRHRLYEVLETANPGDTVSRAFDAALSLLIIANVTAVAIGTIPSVGRAYAAPLTTFEFVSVVVFTIEYLARLWVAVEDPRYRRPVAGRLRYATSWPAVVDLLAILPFYLPFVGIDLRFLRVLRLLRLLRVLKLGRYSRSMQALVEVIAARSGELWSSLTVLAILLFSAGSLMYYIENPVQPSVYSSIPAALYLSISSFSGNAIASPITTTGKVLSALISILSAGLFALPAAILAAGFSERIQREMTDQIVEEMAEDRVTDDDEPSVDRG